MADKKYNYTRAQLKGVLMIAYGPIIPAHHADKMANDVLNLLDKSEQVKAILEKIQEEEDGNGQSSIQA